MFAIKPRFFPISLKAYSHSEVEMTVELENLAHDLCWAECDIILPSDLSLAPDKDLRQGRVRVGIMTAGGKLEKRCKLYSKVGTEPGLYRLKLIAYGFGRDGTIAGREEKTVELRCERAQ